VCILQFDVRSLKFGVPSSGFPVWSFGEGGRRWNAFEVQLQVKRLCGLGYTRAEDSRADVRRVSLQLVRGGCRLCVTFDERGRSAASEVFRQYFGEPRWSGEWESVSETDRRVKRAEVPHPEMEILDFLNGWRPEILEDGGECHVNAEAG